MKQTVKYSFAAPLAFLFLTFTASCGFSLEPEDYSLNHSRNYSQIWVIVIDAGHGGEDTGAIGPDGTMEKDITLGVAKALEKKLKERTDARIILTRQDDTYITLKERTDIANRAYKSGASGVETFFLSFEASDSDVRHLAALENNIVTVDREESDDLESILWDLAETETHHESAILSELIHNRLIDAMGGENRGGKQAPFVVLVGATMPAVLVEVGFISNPDEEKKLTLPPVRENIAGAIAEGVANFEKELEKRKATGYDAN